MPRYESEYSVFSINDDSESDFSIRDSDTSSAFTVTTPSIDSITFESSTPVPFLEGKETPNRHRNKRRGKFRHSHSTTRSLSDSENERSFHNTADFDSNSAGTTNAIKFQHSRKSPIQGPYYIVFGCFVIGLVGVLLYPLPTYQYNIRYRLYESLGSVIEDGSYTGGHRELATLFYLASVLGGTTFISGVIFTYANASPPVLSGKPRSLSRLLKRKPVPEVLNVTIGEVAFISLVLWLNIFWFVAFSGRFIDNLEGDTDINRILAAYGEAFGLLTVLNMVFLGLPSTRNCFWMVSIGIDYAHGVKYHRWIGYITFLALLGHVVPYSYSWLTQGTFAANALPCFTCDVGTTGRDPYQNFFGIVAFVSILLMLITSLNYIRRRYYEVFYYTHHLFIVVLAGAAMHYSNFVFWLYPTICLYVMHRVISHAQSRHPVTVLELEPLPSGVTRLVFARSLKQGGQYDPGQFVYLKIPRLSSTDWHAFSISSYPGQSADSFSIHVKDLGRWTRQLYALAIESKQGSNFPVMHVDGFYGKTQNEFESYSVLVLVAGGIGGTPIASILGHMLTLVKEGGRSSSYTPCKSVYLYWTTRELAIFKEFEPLIKKIRRYDPRGEMFDINLFFTGDEKSQGKIKAPHGISVPPAPKAVKNTQTTYPFHQSARSPARRILVFLVSFGVSLALLIFVRYNYRVLGTDRLQQHLWPLQRLVELLVVIVGAAVGYMVAVQEKKPINPRNFQESLSAYPTFSSKSSVKIRDIGHKIKTDRMNVKQALAKVYGKHKSNEEIVNHGIGVWVSGPTKLIASVEVEASKFRGAFDVHYEEFEL